MNRSGGLRYAGLCTCCSKYPCAEAERRWDSSADGDQQHAERIPAAEPGWDAGMAPAGLLATSIPVVLVGELKAPATGGPWDLAETGVPVRSFSASRAERYYGALESEGAIGVFCVRFGFCQFCTYYQRLRLSIQEL